MRRIASVLVALVLFGGARSARAQPKPRNIPEDEPGNIAWYKKAHSWTVYEENDAFAPTGSDKAYTQGFRLSWNYATWNSNWNTTFVDASLLFLVRQFLAKVKNVDVHDVIECEQADQSTEGGCGEILFGLQQTMYTPADLRIPDLQPEQQPYAGYLAVYFGMSARYAHGLVTSQVMVGTTGPHSFARDIQSLAHWTWSHPRSQPQGWPHQLRNAVQLSLVNQYSGRVPKSWMEHCARVCSGRRDEGRIYDVTPRVELDLGTPMTRASAGGVLRVGYGFPNQFNPDRIPSKVTSNSFASAAPRQHDEMSCSLCDAIAAQKPWGMIFFTGDARAIAWNQLLSGTYADRGRDGWNTVKQIETNHGVWEASYGAAVGWNFATLVYQQVARGAEYHPKVAGGPEVGTFWYKSVTITVHSARSTKRKQ